MEPILKVVKLSKTYQENKKEFKAVSNVSFEINAGEIVALLGPNGAGKTTTVSMISGFLLPTSGDIYIDGQNVKDNRGKAKLGVSFGGDLGFYGNSTANDNLHFFADLEKIPFREQTREIARVLDIVELSNVGNKAVRTFSKGMKQRLHIARAMLGDPKLLLLDEPTSGLDVEIANEIRHTIHHLQELGHAILLTSHTMSEVEELATRILLIGGGKIAMTGSVSDIVNKSNVHHIDRPATLEESYLALAPSLRRKDS
ncbi:ABC transporter ATP-binding protein [Furfurilactobacillus rossiae]|uniref:ABC transporter ATP-binding protein n=1 Tax=Furfurilactobacillus rossiae TaxID=231049 RepID=UPI0015BA0957|nr:ABC transporter ATP-binding protein [Furfurilactobacillus rossiae]MCF6166317.1 ABC transporter ATP-binding protein [Furfurilactobacillus rossiae]